MRGRRGPCITCRFENVKLPMVKKPLNWSGNGTPFCRGETSARNRFWMITDRAKLAKSSVTKRAPRSGRNASRSISTAATIAATQRRHDLHEEGRAALVEQVEGVARDGHELAVREVHEPEDREDHRQPEGQQGVGGAEAEGVDEVLAELLQRHREDHAVLRRGASRSLATTVTASTASAALAPCGQGAPSFVARSRTTPPPSMTAPRRKLPRRSALAGWLQSLRSFRQAPLFVRRRAGSR